MLEFRGETRARVVLIGGGGAVTGTVSSLFSWVWYASRDWPPTVRLSVQNIFSFLPSSVDLASRARNSRRKENSFFCTFPGTPPKIFSQTIDFTNHPTLPELNHVRRGLRTCSRMREQLLVILSWQDKRIIIWRRVSRCVRDSRFFFLSISGKTHTLFAPRGRDDYYADVQLAPDGWRNEVRCVGRRVDLVVLRNV